MQIYSLIYCYDVQSLLVLPHSPHVRLHRSGLELSLSCLCSAQHRNTHVQVLNIPWRTTVAVTMISGLFGLSQHPLWSNNGKGSTTQKFQLGKQLVKLCGTRHDDFLFFSLCNIGEQLQRTEQSSTVHIIGCKVLEEDARSVHPPASRQNQPHSPPLLYKPLREEHWALSRR